MSKIVILCLKCISSDWIKELSKSYDIINYKTEREINEYIRQKNTKIIIPIYYDAMKLLSSMKINCFYLSPKNYKIVDLFNNKGNFIEYCIKNNLEQYIPNTYIIKNPCIKKIRDIQYPAIFKPCISSAGNGCCILYNEKDELHDLEKYVIQEHINDPYEYIGNFLIIEGEILYSLIFKQKYERFYIKTKHMDNYEKIICDLDPFQKIFKMSNYTGVACVDFKILNDQIKIMEINPRFGGTFVCDGHVPKINDVLINYITNLYK